MNFESDKHLHGIVTPAQVNISPDFNTVRADKYSVSQKRLPFKVKRLCRMFELECGEASPPFGNANAIFLCF